MTRPAQVPALGTGMPSAPAFRSAVYSGIGGASPGWFAQQPHIAQEQAAWQAAWAEHLSALLADGYTLTVVGPLAQATLADPLQALFQEWQQLPQTPVPQQGKRFRLQAARLYVLIDGQRSPAEFEALVRQLITAGVHVLQLRDKQLTDAALIDRARRLRALSWQTQALFIMNDRPDIAALVQADGVHVGQEEMELADVRTLCGPEMLIGVSTHTLGQAQQAASGGADYVGVGPTFESGTKRFSNFPGLELVRQVSQHLTLPAFAIGGIHAGNVTSVLQAGLRRIAVSAAVVGAQNPAQAATELLRLLHV